MTRHVAFCIAALGLAAWAEPAFDENLSVLISDIHIQTHPDRPYAFTAGEFPKRVSEILAMDPRPRRVICFGDMTFNGGEPESYAFLRREVDRLERAGIRVVLGMGNHDRRKAFLASFPEAAKGQPVPGRLVYKVDLGHCDLILLDTLNGEERAVGGEIGAAQEAWLKDEIAAAKRPVILGAHHEANELKVGGRPLFYFLRGSDKVVGWINGHGHYWRKENLFWGGGANEDVIRSLMLPTGGAWGEIGLTTLRTYPDRAEATLKMIDMVWHDALKPGEKRPKTFDAIVADQDGERIVFPYERPMLRPQPVGPAPVRPLRVVGLTDQRLNPDWTTVEAPYPESFAKAGLVPIVLPSTTNEATIAAYLDRVDCVMVTGGADVDPSRYGAERSPRCGVSDLVRDAAELAVVAAARRRRLPIIGVCRGCQLLNVAFGGTLWQDLPSEFPATAKVNHGSGEYLRPQNHPVAHTVRPIAGTRLAAVLGSEDLAVNSHHHQAARDLAPGFRASAKAPDGVIEAIESTDYPAFGVQFHPEALIARAEGHPGYDYARLIRILRELRALCGPDPVVQ